MIKSSFDCYKMFCGDLFLTSSYGSCGVAEDTTTDYSVSYDLPGVEAKDIKVVPQNGKVAISYERKYSYVTSKCSSSFECLLPNTVDIKSCDPVLKNGVLTINFKKILKDEIKEVKVREM